MRLIRFLPVLAFLAAPGAVAQPVTGLAGWSVYLDPGHSQNENVGIYGYSEAHKNVRVALELRRLLLETTDIDTVYVSRTDDQQSVSLAQRVDHANATGADFFMSIHSNAAGPTTNYVLTLWPQHRDGSEVAPLGGYPMAVSVAAALAEGMRIDNRGARGECDFYGASSCRAANLGTGKGGSRNYVQSYTNMASELSEAGFHTNPVQNQRNMNADWKRLEARTIYWAILEHHGIGRPVEHVLTGIVTDVESGEPINGARVTVQDTSYTTDTWELLFNRYSNDPDALRNGFYYLDALDGGTYTVTADAEDFIPYADDVVMLDTAFTFHDIGMVSTIPPVVVASYPEDGQDPFRVSDDLVVDFSRPMDRQSVEAALETEPGITGTVSWSDGDRRMVLRPDTLLPRTAYTLRIADTAYGAFLHPFDGNADGIAGGDFEITFTTGFPDTAPARITASHPRQNASDVSLTPVLNLVYDEPLDSTSVAGRVRLFETTTGSDVDGAARYFRSGERGVITFFPAGELATGTSYSLEVAPGIRDLFLNEETVTKTLRFKTGYVFESTTTIEDFEHEFTTDWWQPQQSGSTMGTEPVGTAMSADTSAANGLFGGTASMRLDYAWNPAAGSWLIREYLGSGPARDVTFDAGNALRVYVFGDGGGSRFRFALDDRVPNSAAANHEVSPWYTVDWYGWQPVTWVMYEDGVGTWIGDGVLDGTLRIDSIQLEYVDGAEPSGTLRFDDLQLVQIIATDVETDAGLPDGFVLEQNYPNPFNPQTRIEFVLPLSAHVRLAVYDMLGRVVSVLEDDVLPAGRHATTFDARSLASGVYVYRLETGERVLSRTMLLLR